MPTETLFEFVDAGAVVGIGTEAEAADLIALGILPADLKLVRVGTFPLAA